MSPASLVTRKVMQSMVHAGCQTSNFENNIQDTETERLYRVTRYNQDTMNVVTNTNATMQTAVCVWIIVQVQACGSSIVD